MVRIKYRPETKISLSSYPLSHVTFGIFPKDDPKTPTSFGIFPKDSQLRSGLNSQEGDGGVGEGVEEAWDGRCISLDLLQ